MFMSNELEFSDWGIHRGGQEHYRSLEQKQKNEKGKIFRWAWLLLSVPQHLRYQKGQL